MSSAPDQDPATQAVLQAGSGMAEGASESLSPHQKNGPVAPGDQHLFPWGGGSKDLFALQQEWMERQAQVWLGMLDKPGAKPDQQAAKPEADNKPADQPALAKSPIIDCLRESALVNAECLKRAAEVVPVPEPIKDQVRHVTREEVANAAAPSSFFANHAEAPTTKYQEIRDELKSGDIIVACKGNMQSFNGFISLFIRIVTASSYSHVGVVIKLGNRCFVVEATPPVVRLYPLSKLDSFYVIKMEQALSREDENRLFEYVGLPYSDWNSIVSYFTGKPLANGKLQCAQLVSSFYNWPNLLRPEQIVRYTQEMLGKRMVFVP